MDREQDIPFVYEDGVLKPEGAVDLPEGTRGIAHITSNFGAAVASDLPRRDDSWRSRSLQDLAAEQGVSAVVDPKRLRGDWPQDESIDTFLAEVRKGRR